MVSAAGHAAPPSAQGYRGNVSDARGPAEAPRRHGMTFFRPACRECRKCRSLRVDVERFRPTKSQRRAMHRNADVTIELHAPAVTDDHIRLYNAWHADMHVRRDWPLRRTDADE